MRKRITGSINDGAITFLRQEE